MNWPSILENIGVFGIASGLLAWLVKSLVSQSLARDLKVFEANLQKAHAVEIERLKSDLRADSFEHETRFSRLHQTRAETVAELYKRMVQTEETIRTLLGDVQPAEKEECEKLFWKAGGQTGELFRFFEERRIYFDEELCGLLDAHASHFRQAWLYGSPYVELTPEQREETQQRLNELANAIPRVRHAIEVRMREMLGVNLKSLARRAD
jgi:DNA-directed RNA polymerase subunit F